VDQRSQVSAEQPCASIGEDLGKGRAVCVCVCVFGEGVARDSEMITEARLRDKGVWGVRSVWLWS
jgi:hypothetical protein